MLSLPTRPRAGLDSSRFRVCQNLLVDVERGHGYFDLAGFALGVEDKLGVMTQVATPRGLKLRSVTVCSVRPSLCEAGRDCSGTAHRAGPARVGVFGVGLGLGDGCGAT